MTGPEASAPPDIAWLRDAAPVEAPCPNCRAAGPKRPVLDVGLAPVGLPRRVWRLLRCASCTARFYADPPMPDYAGDEMLSRGRLELYIQQGAGIAALCRPLLRLSLPPGTRLLEIGCGFGFALDFARHALGWTVQGIDPALMAEAGRTRLGLPIDHRLFDAREPGAAWDVVMAAETIEHMSDPEAFLARLVPALAPGGVLILTTPDADSVTPGTAPALLGALLSPGLHTVLQTEASLRRLLRKAGLGHAEIIRDGGHLVVHAAAGPLALADAADGGAVLRAHLETRARACAEDRDLLLGFGGRCLFESVNAAEYDRADRAWALLRPAILARFGLDIDTLAALPPASAGARLTDMAGLLPLNLAAILYAGAMRALAAGLSRATQRARLACAAEAAHRVRRAVGALGMEDALSEDLAWVAAAEALLCEAETGAESAAALIARLPPDPAGPPRHGAYRARLEAAVAAREAAHGWPGRLRRLAGRLAPGRQTRRSEADSRP